MDDMDPLGPTMTPSNVATATAQTTDDYSDSKGVGGVETNSERGPVEPTDAKNPMDTNAPASTIHTQRMGDDIDKRKATARDARAPADAVRTHLLRFLLGLLTQDVLVAISDGNSSSNKGSVSSNANSVDGGASGTARVGTGAAATSPDGSGVAPGAGAGGGGGGSGLFSLFGSKGSGNTTSESLAASTSISMPTRADQSTSPSASSSNPTATGGSGGGGSVGGLSERIATGAVGIAEVVAMALTPGTLCIVFQSCHD